MGPMRRLSTPARVLPLLSTAVVALAGVQAAPAQATATAVSRPGPSSFSTTVDNPYLPYTPGTVMRYRTSGTGGGSGTDVVKVLHRTRVVDGVETVVVRDVARVGGSVVELTWDWFAQDSSGRVWYFGEATRTVRNGKIVSTEGSWEAGKHGAKAGIVMLAPPKVGRTYRQEFRAGVAEDMATVLAVHARASVPYGSFRNVVKTKDFSPLEPTVVENKYYARGIGSVLEAEVKGGTERLELVSVTRP